MPPKKPVHSQKFFTAAEANATLPLVRAIVKDITDLTSDIQGRVDRVARVRADHGSMSEQYQQEERMVEEEIERGQEKLREYVSELTELGVLLKDAQAGLIDFPCWMGNREVYLCWRLGEADVSHWHEVDAGFSGRQKLTASAVQH